MDNKENHPPRPEETQISEYVDCTTGTFKPGARVRIQNELNEILLELCTASGFSHSVTRTVLAAYSKMWDTPTGGGYQRARIEIAKCITSKGDEEAKRRTVSRFYTALDKQQAKCGYMVLEREPGTRTAVGLSFEDNAATLIPWAAPLLEIANDNRKADPRWKKKKLRSQVTQEVVKWIQTQLPKAPPFSETNRERERMALGDYTSQGVDAVARQMERRADVVLNEYQSAVEADRFYVDAIRRLERDRASRKKLYESQLLGLTRDPAAWLGNGGGDKFDTFLSHSKEGVKTVSPAPSAVTQATVKTELETEPETEQKLENSPDTCVLFAAPIPNVCSNGVSKNASFQNGNMHPDMDDYQGRLEANFPEPSESADWALEGFDSMGAGPPLEAFFLEDAAPEPKPHEPLPVPRDVQAGLRKWVLRQPIGWSLILRMTGSGPGRERPLIQIDDCNEADIERLRPYCFLQYQTSPGSYHVWLGVKGPLDQLRSIRSRLLAQLGKTSKANGGGYGSLRFPGSINFKPKYQQPDGTFPMIEPEYRNLAHWTTKADLEQAGLLAPEPDLDEFPAELPATPRGETSDWWPDMQIEEARARDGTRRRRSYAVARWVTISLRAGHSREEVKTHLYEVSSKAKERGLTWTEETVDNVADHIGVK